LEKGLVCRTEVLCDELIGLDALRVDADGARALGVDLEVLLFTQQSGHSTYIHTLVYTEHKAGTQHTYIETLAFEEKGQGPT
jgi:hypothetical protein